MNQKNKERQNLIILFIILPVLIDFVQCQLPASNKREPTSRAYPMLGRKPI
uniref:Uncharacterized protein n=1 Tax=Solanum tuberosum TaxID=4113 RepID=M1BLJ9_SOLTU